MIRRWTLGFERIADFGLPKVGVEWGGAKRMSLQMDWPTRVWCWGNSVDISKSSIRDRRRLDPTFYGFFYASLKQISGRKSGGGCGHKGREQSSEMISIWPAFEFYFTAPDTCASQQYD